MCCIFKVVFLRVNILIFTIRDYQIRNSIPMSVFRASDSSVRAGLSGITESRAVTIFKVPDSCCQTAFQNR